VTDEQTKGKPGAAFFVTLFLLASVLLYPVTFGIAVWLSARGFVERTTVQTVYQPLLQAAVRGPGPVQTAIAWWGEIGIPRGERVSFLIITPDDEFVAVCFGRPPFGMAKGSTGLGLIHSRSSTGL
jgi:hypothetical protein